MSGEEEVKIGGLTPREAQEAAENALRQSAAAAQDAAVAAQQYAAQGMEQAEAWRQSPEGQKLEAQARAAAAQGQAQLEAFRQTDEGKRMEAMAGDAQAALQSGMAQLGEVFGAEDPDDALAAVQGLVSGMEQQVAKASAIGTIVQARLKLVERDVKQSISKHAEDGLGDVVAVWKSEQSGMFERPNPEELVGLLGPIFLRSLRGSNAIYLYISPIFISAMIACLVVDYHEVGCPDAPFMRGWFVVKCVCDFFMWCFRYSIENAYQKWKDESDHARDTAKQAAEQASEVKMQAEKDGTPNKGGMAELRAMQESMKSDAASGLIALAAYDEIITSWNYQLYQLLTPFTFGWDGYGLYLTTSVYCEKCGYDALPSFLYFFSFFYVMLLLPNIIGLLFWAFQMALTFESVHQSVHDKCAEWDADNGGFPVCTFVFEKVVMRDRGNTRTKALHKRKDRLNHRRAVLERELAEIDRETSNFDSQIQEAEEYDAQKAYWTQTHLHPDQDQDKDSVTVPQEEFSQERTPLMTDTDADTGEYCATSGQRPE